MPARLVVAVRDLVRIDPVKVAVAVAAVIGVLAVLGAVEVRYDAAGAFDLDSERKLPAFVAGAILLGASVAAAVAALWDAGRVRVAWLVLAALWALMGVDEALGIHESLEDETGVDWQTLYLPIMAAGAVAWLIVLLRRRGVAALLVLAGGLLWACAGVLEAVQWTGPMEAERAVDGYGIIMGLEEIFEMTGSACFLLGSLSAARALAAVGAGRPDPALDRAALDR